LKKLVKIIEKLKKKEDEFDIEKYIYQSYEKKRKMPIIFYFEELPICEKVKVKEILEDGKTILLEPQKKILKALGEVKEIFFKVQHGDKTLFFKSNIIYGSEDGIEIEFPQPLEEGKVLRLYLRVRPKWNEPIIVDIFSNKCEDESNQVCLRGKALDISETGIGVYIPLDEIEKDDNSKKFFENLEKEKDKLLKMKIDLPKIDTIKVIGKVVKCKDEKKGKILGIAFMNLDTCINSREKIFKYIFKRQKEILKYLTSEEEF